MWLRISKSARAKGYFIQLGALSSRGAAERAWRDARAKNPKLLGNRRLTVEQANVPKKGIYFRVQSGPLADANAAKQLCDALNRRKQAFRRATEIDMPTATIFTCAGPELTADETAFFKEVEPFGFILFANNIETPEQVRSLTDPMRKCVDREDAPVLLDQEGGRVARLQPPQWRATLSAKRYGDLL